MKIKIGDTVELNSSHTMEGKIVKIVGELPAPAGETWEAVVVDGTARTWVMLEHIEQKLEPYPLRKACPVPTRPT